MLDQLADFGLGEDIVVDPEQATGLTVAVEAPGRDRSFLTYLGVTGTANAEIVPPSSLAADHVLRVRLLLRAGAAGGADPPAAATARELGARTYFDTAWDTDGFTAATREELHAILPLVDVFLPNEAEARALAGTDSVTKAGRELQRRSGGWVVIKLGRGRLHGVRAARRAAGSPGARDRADGHHRCGRCLQRRPGRPRSRRAGTGPTRCRPRRGSLRACSRGRRMTGTRCVASDGRTRM